ncbi:MAG: hypothetical protein WBP52_03530, partial [Terriglobales bacterium]
SVASMKTLKYPPSKRKHHRTWYWFSTRQEMVEMMNYVKCKADVNALYRNQEQFFEDKRILKGSTDSASDRAFIELAKSLKSIVC